MATRAAAAAGSLIAALTMVAHGEGPAIRRADARSYTLLDETGRLPKLTAGDAQRLLSSPWQPQPRPPDDPALAEPVARRQILDATCDADLVVVGQATSPLPFEHPNGRWILTAHDVVVSRVVRARDAKAGGPTRLRYVHPSGQLTIGGRAVTTVVDRFPPLVGDEDLLFFLVRIGRSAAYRASLSAPSLVVRGGVLYGLDPDAGTRPGVEGTSLREALRVVVGAVCRPPPVRRMYDRDPRLPPFSGPP